MTSQSWRTVVLGLVLALLVVPFGGQYTVPGLVAIAALVAFDLWRQQVRAESSSRGEVPGRNFADRPAAQRLGIVVGGFLVVVVILIALMKLAGTI
jgi:hypothetical protein